MSAWLSPTSCLSCGQFGRSLSQCQPGHRLHHVYVVVSLAGVSRSVSLVIAYIMFMSWSVWPESLAVSAWSSPTSCLCCGQSGRSLSQCQPGHRLHHVYVVVSLAGVSRSVSLVIAYVMSVTTYSWRSSFNIVHAAHRAASPNFNFQRQLLRFQYEQLPAVSKPAS